MYPTLVAKAYFVITFLSMNTGGPSYMWNLVSESVEFLSRGFITFVGVEGAD